MPQSGPIVRNFPGGQALFGRGVNALAFSATLAQVNAGHVILAGASNAKIKPVGILVRFVGAWAAGTLFRIISDHATPVVVAHVAVANMGDGAKWNEASAELVLGAGFLALLGPGNGLKLDKTGSAMTTGTSVNGVILYQLER